MDGLCVCCDKAELWAGGVSRCSVSVCFSSTSIVRARTDVVTTIHSDHPIGSFCPVIKLLPSPCHPTVFFACKWQLSKRSAGGAVLPHTVCLTFASGKITASYSLGRLPPAELTSKNMKILLISLWTMWALNFRNNCSLGGHPFRQYCTLGHGVMWVFLQQLLYRGDGCLLRPSVCQWIHCIVAISDSCRDPSSGQQQLRCVRWVFFLSNITCHCWKDSIIRFHSNNQPQHHAPSG